MPKQFGDAERLSTEMLTEYQETGSTIPFDAFCGQLFLLRWHQGRLAEIEGPLAEVAGHERIGQAFRAAMAVAHTELGRPDAARQLLALDKTSPRVRDFTWIATSCVLAEVVARLDDVGFAQSLYDELLPFAGQTAVVSTGVTCLGSVDYFLGRVAATSGRPERAEDHFLRSIEVNERLGARPWLALARTHLDDLAQLSVDRCDMASWALV